jgi:hypothetical protein
MAVIVQADPFLGLIRKIGYSVGLEYVLTRSAALVEMYVRERRASLASWRTLVSDGFDREDTAAKGRKTPAEHIGDVLSTLNLIKLSGQQLVPLHGLEAASILRRSLVDDSTFLRALSFLLTVYIIEADGDIFLNCLYSSFEVDRCRELLTAMIERKRRLASSAIRNPSLRQKLYDVISIKTQTGQTRGSSGRFSSPFAKRHTPLDARAVPKVNISEDYIDKVLQSRKGWARELGLFEGTTVSSSGNALLSELSRLGLQDSDGPYLFWPYESDLQRLRIEAETICSPRLRQWDLLTSVATATLGAVTQVFDPHGDYEGAIGMLRECYALYKVGNTPMSSIRHQLPIYVAQPCVVALCSARAKLVFPLPAIIDHEQRSSSRRLAVTNIRGTEGGIVFRD